MEPKKIAVLTDSSADLLPEQIEADHIFVVPLEIHCEDGNFRDGVDIFPEDIYERLHRGELPKTSLPSGDAFYETMDRIIAEGYDGVIAIMMSSGLSGTYNLARITMSEYANKISIAIFDTLSGSLGQGLTIHQMLKDMKAGMGWNQLINERIPFLMKNVYPFFSVDTLEYLRKGGRIGKVSAAAGALLSIKPILTFAPDGQLTSVAKVRGKKLVMKKFVEILEGLYQPGRKFNLAVANGGAPEDMLVLKKMVMDRFPEFEDIFHGHIDSTLSVYIGDGILGAAIQYLE